MDITPMKLHGAMKLSSTSVLLNNIDKYVKRGPIRPFWPWKRTFRAIQANPPCWQFISTLPGKLYAKIEKKVTEQFWSKWPPSAKRANLNLPTLKNDLWSDSTKSIFRYVIYVTPKKLHAKEEEKLLKRFWDRSPPPQSWRTDRQTARRTNRY